MTTADWAFTISIFSFIVSLAGFLWNVWSKFIYPKPKIKVSFISSVLIQQGEANLHALSLSATNYGPGTVQLHMVVGRSRKSRFKRIQNFILNPLHNFPAQTDLTIGPFSGGLPKKLDVGEAFSSYFPLLHEALRDNPVVDIGFTDTFGRTHWARRKDVRKVIGRVKAAYKELAQNQTA